jgi:hypothetical protein
MPWEEKDDKPMRPERSPELCLSGELALPACPLAAFQAAWLWASRKLYSTPTPG